MAILDTIRSLFAELTGEPRDERRFGDDDYRLAAVALLVHVLGVDGERSADERRKLRALVKYRFNLDDAEAEELIAEATVMEGEAVDLYRFTQILNRTLDHEGRRRIIEMMWEMSYADGRVNEFEDNLIWRAADLLHIPGRERLEMRREVGGEAASGKDAEADRDPAAALPATPEPAAGRSR